MIIIKKGTVGNIGKNTPITPNPKEINPIINNKTFFIIKRPLNICIH